MPKASNSWVASLPHAAVEIEELDLQVDADLAQVALDPLGDLLEGAGDAVDDGRKLLAVLVAEAVRSLLPASLVQKLLGLLDVLAVDRAVDLVVEVEHARHQQGRGGLGEAEGDGLGDRLLVDREVHRLAHAHVVHQLLVDLEADEIGTEGLGLAYGQRLVGLQLLDRPVGHVLAGVGLVQALLLQGIMQMRFLSKMVNFMVN